METNEGFTPEGQKPFPSLYIDAEHVGEFSTWPSEALHDRIQTYLAFIQESKLPHHKTIASRIINHAVFELSWRDANNE